MPRMPNTILLWRKYNHCFRQYTTSNYLIRFITKSEEIKLVEDQTFFGCDKKKGVIKEGEHIKMSKKTSD